MDLFGIFLQTLSSKKIYTKEIFLFSELVEEKSLSLMFINENLQFDYLLETSGEMKILFPKYNRLRFQIEEPNRRRFFNNMKLHHMFKPAYETSPRLGSSLVCWLFNGKFHRNSGPAFITKFNNEIVIEKYFSKGLLHSQGDNPAYINNFERIVVYAKQGKTHRDPDAQGNDLPSSVVFKKDGKVWREEYIKNQKYSRNQDETKERLPEIVIYNDQTKLELFHDIDGNFEFTRRTKESIYGISISCCDTNGDIFDVKSKPFEEK